MVRLAIANEKEPDSATFMQEIGRAGWAIWKHARSNCKALLIERFGYLILGYPLTPNGCCPSCGSSIPEKWASAFQGQITVRPFVPRTRPRSDLLVLNS